MLPSLRGTMSGGGPAPEASVILKLMADNRESWDPAALVREDRVVADIPQEDAGMEPTGIAPLRRSVLGKTAHGLGSEWLRTHNFDSALERGAFRQVDPRIALAKAMASIDVWRKASSHFNRAIHVSDVIATQPGVDAEMATEALEGLSLEPQSKLDELTDEQWDDLVRLLAVRDIES